MIKFIITCIFFNIIYAAQNTESVSSLIEKLGNELTENKICILDILEERAKNHDGAAFFCGEVYLFGKYGKMKNYDTAFAFFKISKKLGNPFVDFYKESEWYTKAAHQGHAGVAPEPACENADTARKEVDVNRMELLMLAAFEKSRIEEMRGKDVILFLGNTQIGKSTIINYLTGCRYSFESDLVLDSGIEIAKRGDGSTSTTLFPECYKVESLPFYLCDTQGLCDTRGREEVIISSILLEMVVNIANSVKLVIPFSEYQLDGGGLGIRDFCDTINKLLISRGVDILFIYNCRNPRWRIEKTISMVDSLLTAEYERLKTLCEEAGGKPHIVKQIYKSAISFFTRKTQMPIDSAEETLDSDYSSTALGDEEIRQLMANPSIRVQKEKIESLWLLKKMQKSNILFVDIFDKGECVTQFFDRIKHMDPVQKDHFMFSKLTNYRQSFDLLTCKMFQYFINFLYLSREYRKYEIYSCESYKDCEDYFYFLEFRKDELKKCLREGILPLEMECDIRLLSDKIDVINKLKNDCISKQQKILTKINDIEQEIVELLKKGHLISWKKIEWYEGYCFFSFYCWATYNLRYEDPEKTSFDHYEQRLENHTVQVGDVVEDRSIGKLHINYGTNWKNYCKGEVEIFRERCNLESTNVEVSTLKEKIIELKKQSERFKKRVDEYDEEILSLEKTSLRKREDGVELINEHIKTIETDILKVTGLKDKLIIFIRHSNSIETENWEKINSWYKIAKNLLISKEQSANAVILKKFVVAFEKKDQFEQIPFPECKIEESSEFIRLPCNHVLSKDAYDRIVDALPKICPLCRDPFDDKKSRVIRPQICEINYNEMMLNHLHKIESLISRYEEMSSSRYLSR